MEEVRELFPDIKVAALTADREVVGSHGFRYLLKDSKIPFRIRIRESERLFDGEESMNGKRLFDGVQIGEHAFSRDYDGCGAIGSRSRH